MRGKIVGIRTKKKKNPNVGVRLEIFNLTDCRLPNAALVKSASVYTQSRSLFKEYRVPNSVLYTRGGIAIASSCHFCANDFCGFTEIPILTSSVNSLAVPSLCTRRTDVCTYV